MILYRGLKDTFPSKVDNTPRPGLYGAGVYLSKRKDVANWYSFKSCDFFGIILIYESSSKLIVLREDIHFVDDHPTADFFNLTKEGMKILGVKSSNFEKCKLMDIVTRKGYDGFDLSINFCCEQVVVLKDYETLEITDTLFQSISDLDSYTLDEKQMKSKIRKLKKEFDAIIPVE